MSKEEMMDPNRDWSGYDVFALTGGGNLNFDLNLGINAQARSVLHFLNGYGIEVPDVRYYLETSAFYNGRERCICATMTFQHRLYLHVVFGECRNSDSIFVDQWISDGDINPPTIQTKPEESYEKRVYFDYGRIGKAADYIRKQFEKFVADMQAVKEGDKIRYYNGEEFKEMRIC